MDEHRLGVTVFETPGQGPAGLREWLRQNVHRHGAKFSSRELLQRVVGAPVSVDAFTAYLKQKLGDVYRLDL